jgi:hypothetical protein
MCWKTNAQPRVIGVTGNSARRRLLPRQAQATVRRSRSRCRFAEASLTGRALRNLVQACLLPTFWSGLHFAQILFHLWHRLFLLGPHTQLPHAYFRGHGAHLTAAGEIGWGVEVTHYEFRHQKACRKIVRLSLRAHTARYSSCPNWLNSARARLTVMEEQMSELVRRGESGTGDAAAKLFVDVLPKINRRHGVPSASFFVWHLTSCPNPHGKIRHELR